MLSLCMHDCAFNQQKVALCQTDFKVQDLCLHLFLRCQPVTKFGCLMCLNSFGEQMHNLYQTIRGGL